MIFTSLAWGPSYTAALERLRESGHRHAVPMDLHTRDGEPPSRGAALRLKPEVLLYELLVHDEACWLDADGIIHALPEFHLGEADLAAVINNRGLWESCTVWCSRSAKAIDVLTAWQERMRGEWEGSDGDEFHEAVKSVRPEITMLPVEFGWVKAWHFSAFGNRRAVIEYNYPMTVEKGCCV